MSLYFIPTNFSYVSIVRKGGKEEITFKIWASIVVQNYINLNETGRGVVKWIILADST
jgi:hypothetical protein